jgi:5'-nucleotidase
MRILVSNDDGVHAPGLHYLAEALAVIAAVTVVAPDRNRSGASNSLTLDAPLHTKILPNGYISVTGTPTDCVHIAITGLLTTMPDMVVTGINEGANLSDDVLYSGTVAAAMEGRFLGLPAMAISLAGSKACHYATAAFVAAKLVTQLILHPLPADTLLNVNVPDVPLAELRGLKVTRLGTRHIAEPTIATFDPRGNKIYWIGQPGAAADAGPGTDFAAVNSNYVSLTPLHLDLTYYKIFAKLNVWTEELKLMI